MHTLTIKNTQGNRQKIKLYLFKLLHHFLNAKVFASVCHLLFHLRQPITKLLVFIIEDDPGIQSISYFLFAKWHLNTCRGKRQNDSGWQKIHWKSKSKHRNDWKSNILDFWFKFIKSRFTAKTSKQTTKKLINKYIQAKQN